MIEIDKILQEIDECYEEHRSKDAEQLMHRGIAQAMEEQDEESLLQLLNELLGHYRETGQVENSYAIAERAIAQAKKMGLEGTIPYATTLLNVANAYRAGGRLEDSLSYYAKVRSLYDRVLPPLPRNAGLCGNAHHLGEGQRDHEGSVQSGGHHLHWSCGRHCIHRSAAHEFLQIRSYRG